MNIENIFKSIQEDEINSTLGILCSELENQGYKIEIEGIEVTSAELFENKVPSLEEVTDPLNIRLYKNGSIEQQFSIRFVEYHKIVFQEFAK